MKTILLLVLTVALADTECAACIENNYEVCSWMLNEEYVCCEDGQESCHR